MVLCSLHWKPAARSRFTAKTLSLETIATLSLGMISRRFSPVSTAGVTDRNAGIFGPESMSWRINRESALFLGAGRAALLQLAHPWVTAALQQHSSLLNKPIARFHNTFRIVFTMVFGTADQAFAASSNLYALHTRITGALAEDAAGWKRGDRYQANEINALRWVFATLVDSALLAHESIFGASAFRRTASDITRRPKPSPRSSESRWHHYRPTSTTSPPTSRQCAKPETHLARWESPATPEPWPTICWLARAHSSGRPAGIAHLRQAGSPRVSAKSSSSASAPPNSSPPSAPLSGSLPSTAVFLWQFDSSVHGTKRRLASRAGRWAPLAA